MSEAVTDAPSRMPKGLASSLRSKLGAVRRKLVRVEVIRRLAIALSVALVGLALVLAVDWWVDLSMQVRGGVLGGLGALVALLLLRAVVALGTQRRDEESVALMVEHMDPGLRSRLIASVQFARGKATVPDAGAQAMVERMVEDTESYAEPLAFSNVVNTGPLQRALVALLLLGGLAAGGYYAGGAITRDLLKRAFLSNLPVPRATRVVWTSGDLKIGIGDSVTVEARAEGHAPDRGTLRLRYASGRKEKLSMEVREREPGLPRHGAATTGRYAGTLENVQESFSYVVALHDGRSERHRVRALARPTVTALSGVQTYPAYTNLSPSDHQPGEFLLFPGSVFELTITSSQPLREGAVRLLGGSAMVDSEVDARDPHILHARFAAPDNLTGFTVELLDTEEMASRDATVYRVDILSDEPPKVRIVRPSRQRELVTATARVLVGYEAEDRFGIERLALAYTIGEGGAVQRFDLPIAQVGAKKVAELYDWELGEIAPALKVGEEIQFWIEAYDQNEDTAVGKSAVRILKVVTAREKRDDLLSRVGDSLGRIDQATDDQERLNSVLATWIRAQAHLPDPEPEKKNEE